MVGSGMLRRAEQRPQAPACLPANRPRRLVPARRHGDLPVRLPRRSRQPDLRWKFRRLLRTPAASGGGPGVEDEKGRAGARPGGIRTQRSMTRLNAAGAQHQAPPTLLGQRSGRDFALGIDANRHPRVDMIPAGRIVPQPRALGPEPPPAARLTASEEERGVPSGAVIRSCGRDDHRLVGGWHGWHRGLGRNRSGHEEYGRLWCWRVEPGAPADLAAG